MQLVHYGHRYQFHACRVLKVTQRTEGSIETGVDSGFTSSTEQSDGQPEHTLIILALTDTAFHSILTFALMIDIGVII